MNTSIRITPFAAGLVSSLALACVVTTSEAYERYSSCKTCHGDFTDATSPKNTVFPEDSKHVMHGRDGTYMNTDCDLCHTTGDARNPYLGSSDGKPDAEPPVPGLGCSGCHVGPGLRAHHVANSVNCTSLCHTDDPAPDPESTAPSYYGTAFTLVDNPCNDVLASNTNENWSVGDFLGLDNDGDNLYDQADFDCGPPYRLVGVRREGNNIRVTWETVGGRTDAIQGSSTVSGGYSDVISSIVIPGIGPVTTNRVEVGGATNAARFYRVRDDS